MSEDVDRIRIDERGFTLAFIKQNCLWFYPQEPDTTKRHSSSLIRSLRSVTK
jgi:hypothetical protein